MQGGEVWGWGGGGVSDMTNWPCGLSEVMNCVWLAPVSTRRVWEGEPPGTRTEPSTSYSSAASSTSACALVRGEQRRRATRARRTRT